MIAPGVVGQILNTFIWGLAIAAFVWLLLSWLAPRNSAVRFAVWFCSLVSVAALPFIPTASAGIAPAVHPAKLMLPEYFASWLIAGWAVVAALLLTRLGFSLRHVSRLCRAAVKVDLQTLNPSLAEVLHNSGPRRVTLRVSDEVRVPAALGFFRPAIVVPAWALEEFPPEQMRAILLHEMSHLRRWDDWSNLAQKIIKALFFFHPAIWWIENRLTLEREMACDDLVLVDSSNPKIYVTSLIRLAEKVHMERGLALAQAALGHARQMTLRIRQILQGNRAVSTPAWKPVFGFLVSASVLGFVALPYTPRLVAFEDRAPTAPLLVSDLPASISLKAVVAAKEPAQTVQEPSLQKSSRAVISVRARLGQERKPRVLLSGLKSASPKDMFVVMQSVQYRNDGSAVWTVCVWRITEHDSKRVRPETAVKAL